MPKLEVQKSIRIKAPRDTVYPLVRDFRQWPAWSPWLIVEPNCPIEFAEDGRSYSWDGEIVGSGKIEITGERENQAIDYKLTFLKPWKSVADVRMEFKDLNGECEVTWTMDSSLPFFLFWMKKMMTCLVGMDYDRGLRMLKDLAETGAVPSKLEFPGTRQVPAQPFVGIRRSCPIAEIEEHMGPDFEKLKKWRANSPAQPGGKALTIYHRWDFNSLTTEYSIGIPVDGPISNLPAEFIKEELPACEAYCVEHTGPYRHLGNAWSGGMMHGRAKRFRQSRKVMPFEVYEKEEGAGEDPVTVIHFPVR